MKKEFFIIALSISFLSCDKLSQSNISHENKLKQDPELITTTNME